MDERTPSAYETAVHDFRDARRRAALHDILAHITGRPADLLSFEDTRTLVNGEAAVYRGLQEIPLKNIVGSVGRYRDFTRSFLPRREDDERRWARLKAQILRIGFNPIELYQIGQAYFVLDGNHRVSIARARRDLTIQAYVTEIPTKVPLKPDDSPDDLIRKAEQSDFFEQTHIDINRPDTDLRTSAPGAYHTLNRRIARFQSRYSGANWPELALHWHDEDFLPFIRMVREKGLQRDFPGRTETDLYAWIIRRQDELEKTVGWHVPLRVTAVHLLKKASLRPGRVATRFGRRLSDIAIPDPLEPGPRPGDWRQWALATHREDHLFTDYLVPISGSPQSWLALEMALVLAGLEQDFVHGLHVIPEGQVRDEFAVQEIKVQFESRLAAARVSGELTIDNGSIARKICDYSAWADLVILNIFHPPGANPLQKITSGLHTIIHRSQRPLILVPALPGGFNNLLLAYDGSAKAREALYLTAYLVGKWGLGLAVLTSVSGKVNGDMLEEARRYLETQGLHAQYILEKGDPAENILAAAEKTSCDILLMGGYGHKPVLEMVLGSTIDRVLREAHTPLFLCR